MCRQYRTSCKIISSRLQQGQPLEHGHGVLVALPIILEALHKGLEAHWLRSHLIGQIWRKPCIKQAHAGQDWEPGRSAIVNTTAQMQSLLVLVLECS